MRKRIEEVTSGQIAERAEITLEQASYCLRRIGAKPTRRVGIVRLFDADVLTDVRDYLATIKPRKHSL